MTKHTPTRFILLSTARTGSNLLALQLKAHPNVAMHGELFNLDALKEPQLKKALADPTAYMLEYFNKAYSEETRAVGFKLFYDHLTPAYFNKLVPVKETAAGLNERIARLRAKIEREYQPNELFAKFDETWQYLANKHSIRIIHLKRANKLQTLVSLKTAYMTDKWMIYGNETPTRTVVPLHPDECVRFFKCLENEEKAKAELFKMHPVLDVDHDRLVNNKDEVLCHIFDFLGLPYHSLTTQLKKQITSPLGEVISNFNELKQHFSQTSWARYF